MELSGPGVILNTTPIFPVETEEYYEKSHSDSPGEILTGRFTNTSKK